VKVILAVKPPGHWFTEYVTWHPPVPVVGVGVTPLVGVAVGVTPLVGVGVGVTPRVGVAVGVTPLVGVAVGVVPLVGVAVGGGVMVTPDFDFIYCAWVLKAESSDAP
jgi:hypothetical protein